MAGINSFLSEMRRPKNLMSWAGTSAIRAGESDPVEVAIDLARRGAEREGQDWGQGIPGRGGNIGRIGNIHPGTGLPIGTDPARPYNVVYDRGPENFSAQMKLNKEKLASENRQFDASNTTENRGLSLRDEANRRENLINKQNADTARFKAENPGLELKGIPDGNMLMFNPITGKIDDTGMASGLMSDQRKMSVEQANRLAQIGAQNAGSLENTRLRNQGDREVANIRAAVPNASTTMSPNEEAQNLMNKARMLANTNPDFAAALSFGEDGKTFGFNANADPRIVESLNNQLYGKRGDINLSVPKLEGLGSSSLGTNVGGLGMPRTSSGQHPSVTNSSSTAPHVTGGIKPIRRRHKTTGTIEVSMDGGKTWNKE